jgi:hypothetical protein
LAIASIASFDSSSVIGMPATVEYRGSGTIVSPWPPSTNEWTFSTDTFSSMATNVLMRAESSTPAMPMMRSRGNLVRRNSACDMASSGLATGTTIAFGTVLHEIRRDALHDLEVVAHEIVAAHPRLARLARRDHDDVGAGGRAPVAPPITRESDPMIGHVS